MRVLMQPGGGELEGVYPSISTVMDNAGGPTMTPTEKTQARITAILGVTFFIALGIVSYLEVM